MAIVLRKKGTIEVVLSFDSALDMTEEEYEVYAETFDETKLKLKEGEEPTRFVLRTILPFDEQTTLRSKMFKVSTTGESNVDLSATYTDVRMSLVDIKNPANVPEDEKIVFTKDRDGYASKELMSSLTAAGVTDILYAAVSGFRKPAETALKKS